VPVKGEDKLDTSVTGNPAQPAVAHQTKVWDGLVRAFHWSTVVLVVALVVTAHSGDQEVHMTLGTDLLLVVTVRLLWGMAGSRHARFASFLVAPREGLRYLQEVLRGHPRRYLGHNPAGALMVVALLADLSLLLLSGLVLQATLEFDGPLVDVLHGIDDLTVSRFLAIHRLAVYGLYVLVPLHLLGVAAASYQHRENLLKAMITGYKSSITER